MAKQIGPIKFSGRLDDLCGRQTEDGVILQTKTGPTREQVLHNERFTNTRYNAREFGGAVAASRLLRWALGSLNLTVKHAKLVSHMNKKLHEVAMSDMESNRGDRCVNKGNIQLLKGFDYHPTLKLDAVLPVKLEHTLDVVSGRVQLNVPGSLVRRKRVFPKQATHFRIVSCAGAVDFNTKGGCSFDIAESALLPLGKVMEALQLEHKVTAKPGEVLLHMAGMVFYEVVNGEARLLRGGVLKVVEVARVECANTCVGLTEYEPDAILASVKFESFSCQPDMRRPVFYIDHSCALCKNHVLFMRINAGGIFESGVSVR